MLLWIGTLRVCQGLTPHDCVLVALLVAIDSVQPIRRYQCVLGS
jgi:hypothetical protein